MRKGSGGEKRGKTEWKKGEQKEKIKYLTDGTGSLGLEGAKGWKRGERKE